jgi:hypothetical protein
MNRRHLCITVVAACHLALVVCGASGQRLLAGAGPAIRLYGVLSGAENSFGFFAPGVASQIRVTFTLQDQAGRQWTLAPPSAGGREVELRMISMLSLFRAEGDELRDVLAASWAGTMLVRSPEARQVTVLVEEQVLPAPDPYRQGARPRWEMLYQATFAHDREGPLAQER